MNLNERIDTMNNLKTKTSNQITKIKIMENSSFKAMDLAKVEMIKHLLHEITPENSCFTNPSEHINMLVTVCKWEKDLKRILNSKRSSEPLKVITDK